MSLASARRARRGLVTLAAALLLTGCSSSPKAAPEAKPTPLSQLNTAALSVPRIDFCNLVPSAAITDALGGKADDTSSWGNGDREAVTSSLSDVVHELGCGWTTDAGAQAKAWVFARPVTADFARTAIAAQRTQGGCRLVTGPEFGTPALTQLCRTDSGTYRARHAGLFGQTWLTCEVTGASGDDLAGVRTRADQWCVQVAQALDAAS